MSNLIGSKIKLGFGKRLRTLRKDLGYTQQEMAYALGIKLHRYNKYEIGRSEPTFEILIRLAHLTGVDLDYLIAGGEGWRPRKAELPWDQVRDLLRIVPTPALIYDRYNRMIDCNHAYHDLFFPTQKGIAKPGTALEVLARAWSNTQDIDPLEIERYIAKRLDRKLFRKSPVILNVGSKALLFAETITTDFRFVQITDITDFRT